MHFASLDSESQTFFASHFSFPGNMETTGIDEEFEELGLLNWVKMYLNTYSEPGTELF